MSEREPDGPYVYQVDRQPDLREGVELYAVHMKGGPTFVATENKTITVRMQAGQMAMVPWALVEYRRARVGEREASRPELLNLAHAARVLIEPEDPDKEIPF